MDDVEQSAQQIRRIREAARQWLPDDKRFCGCGLRNEIVVRKDQRGIISVGLHCPSCDSGKA